MMQAFLELGELLITSDPGAALDSLRTVWTSGSTLFLIFAVVFFISLVKPGMHETVKPGMHELGFMD